MTRPSLVASDLLGYGVYGSRPAAGIAGRRYFSTDNPVGEWLDNGTLWLPVGQISSRRSSDSSTIASDVTLNDDDQITIPVAASTAYRFEYWSLWTAGNVTMDVKVGWNVPASATMKWGGVNNPASNTAGAQWGVGGVATTANTFLVESQSFGSGGATGSFGLLFGGILVVAGTAGNFIPQWSQNTSDAGTLKALANSVLHVWRIG